MTSSAQHQGTISWICSSFVCSRPLLKWFLTSLLPNQLTCRYWTKQKLSRLHCFVDDRADGHHQHSMRNLPPTLHNSLWYMMIVMTTLMIIALLVLVDSSTTHLFHFVLILCHRHSLSWSSIQHPKNSVFFTRTIVLLSRLTQYKLWCQIWSQRNALKLQLVVPASLANHK